MTTEEIKHQKEIARIAAQEAIDLCKAQFHMELMELVERIDEACNDDGWIYEDMIKGLAKKYAPEGIAASWNDSKTEITGLIGELDEALQEFSAKAIEYTLDRCERCGCQLESLGAINPADKYVDLNEIKEKFAHAVLIVGDAKGMKYFLGCRSCERKRLTVKRTQEDGEA